MHDDGRGHAAQERRLDTRQATGTDHDRVGVKLLSLVADRPPALAFRETAANLKSGRARVGYPRSDVSRATWLAISSRPSSCETSFDTGAVRIVAGSPQRHWLPYGEHHCSSRTQ